MGLQTEIKDLKTIKSTLEKRTSELQAKAEKVPQLEAEKKKLLEREKKFDDASKTIKEKLDEAESKIKSLEEENTKLRSAPQSIENVPKDPKIRQTLNKGNFVSWIKKSFNIQNDRSCYA